MSLPGPSAQTRRRILDGAALLFAEKGVKDTSVQDILQAAGVSRRTYYQYFHGKEGALLELYEEYTQQLVQWTRSAIDDTTDPLAKVQGVIGAYMRFLRDGGQLLAAMQAESFRGDSPLLPVREKAFDALVDAIDEGVSSVLDVRADPLVYRGMLMGIEGLIMHARQRSEDDRIGRERLAGVIEALVRPVLANAPTAPKRPDGLG